MGKYQNSCKHFVSAGSFMGDDIGAGIQQGAGDKARNEISGVQNVHYAYILVHQYTVCMCLCECLCACVYVCIGELVKVHTKQAVCHMTAVSILN